MIFTYSPDFITDLQDPNNEITLFYAQLISNNFSTVNYKNEFIPINVDILNENYYIIEITSNIINKDRTVDGIKLSLYNIIKLYYAKNNSEDKYLATTIRLVKDGSSALLDYARNIIYIDLTKSKVCAKIHLSKLPGYLTDGTEGGVILSHKHNLLETEIQESTSNIYSSDYILNYLQRNNIYHRVGYISIKSEPNQLFSHKDGIYKISGDDSNYPVESNLSSNYIDKSNIPSIPLYGKTASTQEIYQFNNGLLTPFGLELTTLDDNISLYDMYTTNFMILSEDCTLMTIQYGPTEFNISSTSEVNLELLVKVFNNSGNISYGFGHLDNHLTITEKEVVVDTSTLYSYYSELLNYTDNNSTLIDLNKNYYLTGTDGQNYKVFISESSTSVSQSSFIPDDSYIQLLKDTIYLINNYKYNDYYVNTEDIIYNITDNKYYQVGELSSDGTSFILSSQRLILMTDDNKQITNIGNYIIINNIKYLFYSDLEYTYLLSSQDTYYSNIGYIITVNEVTYSYIYDIDDNGPYVKFSSDPDEPKYYQYDHLNLDGISYKLFIYGVNIILSKDSSIIESSSGQFIINDNTYNYTISELNNVSNVKFSTDLINNPIKLSIDTISKGLIIKESINKYDEVANYKFNIKFTPEPGKLIKDFFIMTFSDNIMNIEAKIPWTLEYNGRK